MYIWKRLNLIQCITNTKFIFAEVLNEQQQYEMAQKQSKHKATKCETNLNKTGN